MLEKIIKRKFYLKAHLDAPLLKEREEYLTKKSEKGLVRSSLLGMADYLLRIVQLLDLHEEATEVSLSEIDKAAELWAATIKNHPMKRKYAPTSKWKFTGIAIDWLSSIGRMDSHFTDATLFVNSMYTRLYNRRLYFEAPFLKERTEYLSNRRELGYKWLDLKQCNAYLLHVIKYLSVTEWRKITASEIRKAAKQWADAKTWNPRKKQGSVYAERKFICIATDWLQYMDLYIPDKEHIPNEEYLSGYINWMRDECGLSEQTTTSRFSVLKQFLIFMEEQNVTFTSLSLPIFDGYTRVMSEKGFARRSISCNISILRGFITYCENRGWCKRGLAKGLKAPRMYHNEDVPSAPDWEVVQRIVEKKHTDKPVDIRDYAMLLLLCVYGLRCGEVTNMQLKDIDWRAEKIYLRRSKRCKPQVFPLEQSVGDAILRYIKEVRHNESASKNVFLSMRAPYCAISNSSLYQKVSALLKAEDVELRHYGPHSLRHATATHLLNNGMTLKEVSSQLGHQQLDTTRIYAKVDMAGLRKVADMTWKEVLQ